jgi:hypothetical protein
MEVSVVDAQEQVISDLEAEVAELEKEFSTESAAETETTEEPEEESAPPVESVEEETATSEVADEKPAKKPKMTELETLDKRWRDGVSWNTKLNQENIALKAKLEADAAELEALKAKLKAAPEAVPETVLKAKEEYPELMETIVPALKDLIGTDKSTIEAKLAELDTIKEEIANVDRRNAVLAEHPDLDLVTREDSRFWTWLNEDTNLSALQKNTVVNSGTAKDLSLLFTQFKREYRELVKRRTPAQASDNTANNQKLKDAVEATAEPKVTAGNRFTVPVKQPTALTESDIDKMSLEEFEKLTDDDLKKALAGAAMM